MSETCDSCGATVQYTETMFKEDEDYDAGFAHGVGNSCGCRDRFRRAGYQTFVDIVAERRRLRDLLKQATVHGLQAHLGDKELADLIDQLETDNKRLREIENVARKLVYVAAPPVSPIRLALGLPALCEALGIDPVEAAEKATAEEEAAKRRVAEARVKHGKNGD